MSHAVVFPSSTSRDLPEYRAAVLEACRELNLGVATMEDFPATGHGATQSSLHQLDKCDVYLGIFAYRYGYVESGYPCSVTEAEYDHARKRGLECLCFFVAAEVAWPEERKEHDALPRVRALAQRIQGEQVVNWFRSPDDLKHKAYRALDEWLERTGRRPRGPRQIAAPPADFVGRGDELAFLLNGFERGASIFGARGLGGVGKTTLAQVLAERLAPRFPDGQLYLDLRGVGDNPVSWRDALAHVILAYRPEERLPDGDDALKGLYRTVLHGKRALLLMDNAADARQVEPLMPPSGCALLVTSRRRFHLPGLLVRDLDVLSPTDAVALLRSIAPHVGSEADEIAALCGHLPLAVRLAGTLLAVRDDLTPANYLGRLRKARLSERSGLSEVATAIRLSEELLPEPLRTRWRELALFHSGFNVGWAAAVWDVADDTADDWLGILRGNSLLDWDGETRFYRLHDLVREYDLTALDTTMWEAAGRRHAELFCDMIADYQDYSPWTKRPWAGNLFFSLSLDVEAGFRWALERKEKDPAIAHLCCRLTQNTRVVGRWSFAPRMARRTWRGRSCRVAEWRSRWLRVSKPWKTSHFHRKTSPPHVADSGGPWRTEMLSPAKMTSVVQSGCVIVGETNFPRAQGHNHLRRKSFVSPPCARTGNSPRRGVDGNQSTRFGISRSPVEIPFRQRLPKISLRPVHERPRSAGSSLGTGVRRRRLTARTPTPSHAPPPGTCKERLMNLFRRQSPRPKRSTITSPRRRPLTIEVLESRTLLAGNVTTATLGDTLRLTGDAADNAIEVQPLASDQYRIIGLGGTTVNGKPEVVAKTRKDLSIDLGGGRDSATLTAVSVTRDALLANSEEVSIGSTSVGHDLGVTVGTGTGGSFGNAIAIDSTTVGHDLAVATGDGTAEVSFGKLSVQGRSTVRTGSGNDLVKVKDSTFLGLATFDGGGGTDTFQDLGGNSFASALMLIDFEVF